MKICLLSKQYGPGGGSERYAVELANGLAARGHTVDVYTLTNDRGSPHIHDNVSVEYIAKRRRVLVTLETLYYGILSRVNVDFSEYDVIHGTLMPASAIGLSIQPPGVPLILTSHGTSLGEVRSHKLEVPTDYLKKFVFHPMNVGFDMLTAPRGERIIAISRDAQNELASRYPISEERLIRIPHGVDTERFNPDAPAHPAPATDRLSCLHVGRLVSRKHISLAINALAETNVDCELLVAGTGPHHDRLEKIARYSGVADRVRFLGYVPDSDLPALYASSDVFLFLSRYEGFGLTFLEAMASGLPVVGTAVGGFPDIVEDGTTGIITERNPGAVAKNINTLTATAERRELGTNARVKAEELTWDVVAEKVEQVYDSVVETSS